MGRAQCSRQHASHGRLGGAAVGPGGGMAAAAGAARAGPGGGGGVLPVIGGDLPATVSTYTI